MKRFPMLVFIILFAAISGCNSNQPTHNDYDSIDEALPTHGLEDSIEYSPFPNELREPRFNEVREPVITNVEAMEFSSLEEFLSFIKDPKEDEDFIDLAAIDKYYMPIGLPDNYKLYKITVGKADVGFWYLPEECLISRDTTMEAESLSRHFLFIFTRGGPESPMDGIKKQHGFTNDDLVNGKYLFVNMPYIVYWEAEGELMMLYLPTALPKDANGNLDPTGKPFVSEIDLESVYDYSAEVVFVN